MVICFCQPFHFQKVGGEGSGAATSLPQGRIKQAYLEGLRFTYSVGYNPLKGNQNFKHCFVLNKLTHQ